MQVDEPAANAWNGFVASLQANQAKQVKQTAKQQCRHKQPKQDGWYGTVYWNDAWDDAMKKETARPPDNPAQAQPQDSAGEIPDQHPVCQCHPVMLYCCDRAS